MNERVWGGSIVRGAPADAGKIPVAEVFRIMYVMNYINCFIGVSTSAKRTQSLNGEGRMKQITSFYLDNCLLGIESGYVNSILPPGKVLRIPQKEEQIFNATMQLADQRFIHIVNTEKLMGLTHAPLGENSRVIVLQTENPLMGVIVDDVARLGAFEDSDVTALLPLSRIDGEYLSGTVTGAGGEIVLLLNAQALLNALR